MDINALKSSQHAIKFSGGEIIAKENDSKDEMYVVLEGQVNLYKNYGTANEIKIKTLGTGSFFGETSLFLQNKLAETAIAEDDIILYKVGRASAVEFIQTQPMLTGLLIKNLCAEVNSIRESAIPTEKVSAPPPSGNAADASPPPPKEKAPEPPSEPAAPSPPPVTAPAIMPDELFPKGHKVYTYQAPPTDKTVVYKKTMSCPICEVTFQSDVVRTTRLKAERRDKDFRCYYTQQIEPIYYEIVTCPVCWFSNFESEYTKPIVSRFKESVVEVSKYKLQMDLDLANDYSINAVFTRYYLALKGVPLFYKSHEMYVAKIWLRLKWLYSDVKDKAMEELATKNAHRSYLSAFEKAEVGTDVLQQMCVLMGELSLLTKDIPNAKLFFIKARGYKNVSQTMVKQAEDGIDIIRKIEAGQLEL